MGFKCRLEFVQSTFINKQKLHVKETFYSVTVVININVDWRLSGRRLTPRSSTSRMHFNSFWLSLVNSLTGLFLLLLHLRSSVVLSQAVSQVVWIKVVVFRRSSVLPRTAVLAVSPHGATAAFLLLRRDDRTVERALGTVGMGMQSSCSVCQP